MTLYEHKIIINQTRSQITGIIQYTLFKLTIFQPWKFIAFHSAIRSFSKKGKYIQTKWQDEYLQMYNKSTVLYLVNDGKKHTIKSKMFSPVFS